MCWMVALGAVGAVAGVAGTGMSVAGSVAQGEATASAADTNAVLSMIAAQTSEWEAEHIREDTRFEVAKIGRETKLAEGAARSAAASSGFDLASVDLVQHFEDILEVGHLEATQVARRGYLEADSRVREGKLGRWQAGRFRDASRSASSVAGISAAGQGISGLGNVGLAVGRNWEGYAASWSNWRNG